ncbi:hypothetical protein TWF718_005785 [Orbilia javanica]|uniref:Uncharacterized protein n=1 Tax=Orbilia javanica TaxID=47235 RepID=A0AAN8RDT3_9PEZI
MTAKRVENFVGALRDMQFKNPLLRRKRARLSKIDSGAGGRTRKSIFQELFDYTDEEAANKGNSNGDGSSGGKKEPPLNTTKETTASSPSQHQPPPIIIHEDQTIVSGTFNTNYAWLRENIPDLFSSESFLSHENSEPQNVQESNMGKRKTSKQAHRKQPKASANPDEKSSTQSTPVPGTPKTPDTTKAAAPDVGPNSKLAIERHNALLRAIAVAAGVAPSDKPATKEPIAFLAQNVPQDANRTPETSTSGTAAPEARRQVSDTRPTKDQLTVDSKLFEPVTDIGIFTKWKREEFLSLSRNELLVFIHLHCREKMPTAEASLGRVRRIFFNEVYPKHYWISWVRDVVLAFLRNPAATELAGKETINKLKIAAEDIDFLEALAPELKALCQERFSRAELRHIGIPVEEEGGKKMVEGGTDGTGGKKKNKNKKKWKGKEVERGEGEAPASMGSSEPVKAPYQRAQVHETREISDLADAFAGTLLRKCA